MSADDPKDQNATDDTDGEAKVSDLLGKQGLSRFEQSGDSRSTAVEPEN